MGKIINVAEENSAISVIIEKGIIDTCWMEVTPRATFLGNIYTTESDTWFEFNVNGGVVIGDEVNEGFVSCIDGEMDDDMILLDKELADKISAEGLVVWAKLNRRNDDDKLTISVASAKNLIK